MDKDSIRQDLIYSGCRTRREILAALKDGECLEKLGCTDSYKDTLVVEEIYDEIRRMTDVDFSLLLLDHILGKRK